MRKAPKHISQGSACPPQLTSPTPPHVDTPIRALRVCGLERSQDKLLGGRGLAALPCSVAACLRNPPRACVTSVASRTTRGRRSEVRPRIWPRLGTTMRRTPGVPPGIRTWTKRRRRRVQLRPPKRGRGGARRGRAPGAGWGPGCRAGAGSSVGGAHGAER